MAEVAIPLVVQSYGWAGNDGNWSTFALNVGTPSQTFELLPSTADGEMWVPVPEACVVPYPNCATSRGVLSTQGDQKQGFQTNESTSWKQIGIYELGFESNLYGDDDAGLYGQDTITIGSSPSVENQTIAGIATSNFWLGSIGLGDVPSQFNVVEQGILTLLSTLKTQNVTPSLAYGYNAGASYRNSAGGLVLGGYDGDALDVEDSLVSPTWSNGAGSLSVSLQSLVATNTLQGTVAMPIVPGGFNMSVDSTIAQLWLPEAVCDELANSLNLQYDNSTQLYLVNSTVREQLLSSAPEFTFTMSNSGWSNKTINIVLPYAALDLQVEYPYYNSSMSYFPIRRAANETQYVLGRAFLQEAYIIVDWERQNFTLGQSLHTSGVSKNIVPILAPDAVVPGISSGLSTGAIVGIAVGGVAAVVMISLLGWLFWRLRQRRNNAAEMLTAEEEHYGVYGYQDGKVPPNESDQITSGFSPPGVDRKGLPSPFPPSDAELMSEEYFEAHGNALPHQLMSNAIYELPENPVGHELPGQPQPGRRAK